MPETDEQEDLQSSREFNRQIIDRVLDADNGKVKEAATAGTNMIRRKIREEGFSRRIIPPKTVTNDDLDRVVEHDKPVIIEDMEPKSKGAKSITFDGTPDTEFYYGDKFVCVFNPYTTPEYTKNVNELRTYNMDLRQTITDNALKDVQTEEDSQLITTVDEIVGPTNGVGKAGFQQNFIINGGITRDTYTEALNILEDNDLNNGVFLMNRRTGKEFLKWNRSEIGGDTADRMFTEGMGALPEAKIMGVNHVFTIKRNLVPDNTVYLFTEPAFLGKFYELQQLVMYVEKEKSTLRFSAEEIISITLANLAGMAKVTFQ